MYLISEDMKLTTLSIKLAIKAKTGKKKFCQIVSTLIPNKLITTNMMIIITISLTKPLLFFLFKFSMDILYQKVNNIN